MMSRAKIHPNDHNEDPQVVPPSSVPNTLDDGATSAKATLMRRTKYEHETACPPLHHAASKHRVMLHDLLQVVAARSQARRLRFWLKCLWCLVRILWNVASPIKAYMLSFYALSGDDLVFSQSLNWTMEIDYQYARALYDMSGIPYAAPENKPLRFINMYTDFVVFNRATKWAHHLDDFQQDPSVGLYCRTSLVLQRDLVRRLVAKYCLSGLPVKYDVYDEPTNCRVNEVSEAAMCLKGIDVLTLMNYEWQSAYDPNNTFVQEGARLYQAAVFPDLDACLARRRLLVQALGRDQALLTLAQELAFNYSLDATGFGGKKGLYAEYRFYQGFTDLSGAPSGSRYSKMSGSLPERTQPIESDLNALVVGRERLWWMAGLSPKDFRDRVALEAQLTPPAFYALQINSNATAGRFVDGYAINYTGPSGTCQVYEPVRTSNHSFPAPIYVDGVPDGSVLSLYPYKVIGPRVIRDNNVTAPQEIARIVGRMSTNCITRDGCVDGTCKETMTTGLRATFSRSGICQDRKVSQSVLHRQGFVDAQCIGEGTGSETLSIKFVEPVARSDNSTFEYHYIRNTADPGAIVACMLGGRIPQKGAEPFPNVFLDLVDRGANTIVTTTFSRGTEKVLVNMYALVSLLGCAVFAVWVCQNVTAVLQKLHQIQLTGVCDRVALAQLVDSYFTINFSTVSHGRNIQLSKVILYLNLVAWYIGAADINCTWWVNGVDLWTPGFQLRSSDSPYYECKPGTFVAHLGSLFGIVRLVSISYNFKSLTCQHLILRGATRYARSLISPVLLFGLLPTFLLSIVITGINHLRHRLRMLEILHNQFFIIVLWVAFLFAYHRLLQHQTVGRLYVDLLCKLRVCGKQKVTTGSVAAALIGPYYLTRPESVQTDETEWIPLSVAMESASFELDHLDFTMRRYSLTGPMPAHHKTVQESASKKRVVEIPDWVLDDDEFYFF